MDAPVTVGKTLGKLGEGDMGLLVALRAVVSSIGIWAVSLSRRKVAMDALVLESSLLSMPTQRHLVCYV